MVYEIFGPKAVIAEKPPALLFRGFSYLMEAVGGVSERLKETVLKTVIPKRYREFESRPHRPAADFHTKALHCKVFVIFLANAGKT